MVAFGSGAGHGMVLNSYQALFRVALGLAIRGLSMTNHWSIDAARLPNRMQVFSVSKSKDVFQSCDHPDMSIIPLHSSVYDHPTEPSVDLLTWQERMVDQRSLATVSLLRAAPEC